MPDPRAPHDQRGLRLVPHARAVGAPVGHAVVGGEDKGRAVVVPPVRVEQVHNLKGENIESKIGEEPMRFLCAYLPF